MRKIFIFLILTILFASCTTTEHYYSYQSHSLKYDGGYNGAVKIVCSKENYKKENSPLDVILLTNIKDEYPKNSLKVISSQVKIVAEGKEYFLKTEKEKNRLRIEVLKQGLKINSNFTVYIGKVELESGLIVDVPPLTFSQYITEFKAGILAGVVNTNSSLSQTSETVPIPLEEYKKIRNSK